MIGPILNSAGIILGGAVGAGIARYIPKRIQDGLPAAFALISLSIGITMIIKVQQMPAVVLAMILGTATGELLSLEKQVRRCAESIRALIGRIIPTRTTLSPQEFSTSFSALIVLFTASGLGIVGALTEGVNGSYQLLLVKALMDFFTAIIFAMSLGVAVMTIAIPQFIFQAALLLLAQVIMPYMDSIAFNDFTACGGVVLLAIGLRMAHIKIFPVVNYLPALLYIVPLSYLCRHLPGL